MTINSTKDQYNKKNYLVNKYLCNFIELKFLRKFLDQNGNEISQNDYARLCGTTSSTITKMKKPEGYDIPISTVYNICRHEKYSLKKLFTEFEDIYGEDIQD